MSGDGWSATTLGEFVALKRGFDLPEHQRAPGPVPILGSFGVTGFHNEAKVAGPGVTVGRSGASMGVVSFTADDYWPLNTVVFSEDFRGNHPRFTYYMLKTCDFTGFNSGSAQPSLNRNYIAGMPLDVPRRTEQARIAGVLGALDDKIEHNLSLAKTLTDTARSMFAARFSDQRGWPMGLLGDLCTTQYGFTASATEKRAGPKFLRVMDINKRPWIDWAAVPYCEIDSKSLERYRLHSGDIVVARMADPGKSAIIDDAVDAVFASYLVRLKTPSLAHAYFVYDYLQSGDYAEYAASAITGSVQKNMNAKVIVGARLPIPPDTEMERHLAEVLPLRLRMSAAIRESSHLAAIRDALLPKLVSGRMRVPESYDPDDVLGTVAERAAAS